MFSVEIFHFSANIFEILRFIVEGKETYNTTYHDRPNHDASHNEIHIRKSNTLKYFQVNQKSGFFQAIPNQVLML